MDLNGRDLNDYILGVSQDERIKLLKDEKIRDKYLNTDNHYPFVWLVNELGDDLVYFLDENYLKKIVNSNLSVEKIISIMTSMNKNTSQILSKKDVIEFILTNDKLIDYMYCLDNDFGNSLIDYGLEKNDLSILKCIGKLKPEYQKKCFTSYQISQILQQNSDNDDFLFYLDGDVINRLIIFKRFLNLLLNCRINQLDNIVQNGFIFPNHLLQSDIILEKYLSIINPHHYRHSIDLLMNNNYELATNIENKRKKMIKTELTNLKEGYISILDSTDTLDVLADKFGYKLAMKIFSLKKEKNIEKRIAEYQEITKILQLELIIDTYFKDIPYNFLANLKVLLNYQTSVSDCLVEKSHLELYKKIINFKSLSMDKRLDLINSFDDSIDYVKMFYDDYSNCKNHSINMINSSILKLNKSSKIYNKALSQRNGIDIYTLQGEDFYAYVHVTKSSRSYDRVNWHNKEKTISLSLIGSKNINTFGHGIVFGFFSLNPNNVMHMYHSDSYTSKEFGSRKINQIYQVDEFVKNTMGYNEILYSEKNLNSFNPDFLVCFDYITSEEKTIAKSMNIPIVMINSDCYKKNYALERSDENKYIKYFDSDPIMEGRRYK